MDMDDVMKNYSSTNLNQQEEEKEPEKPTPEANEDSTPPSDYNLIKQVGTKIKKTKESRNSDIKETKNLEDEKADQYGLQDDVDFHMKKMKVSKDDIRTDQRNSSLKVSKSSGSYKEDIILDPVIDDNLEETKDPKNIIGSQSLEGKETTPEKAENESENSPNEETLANSDSKYATVSILSEMKEKETHPHQENANKLADLIYSAMLAEIKAELFPPRPLFLLTADLDKIELEQAMIYLNDMSVEKEAELLKEFLKYSGSDDIDLSSWDDTNENDNGKTDNKMFSDSGKLVLYGRPGISTDLFSIEKYVDELADEVDAK